MFGKQRIVSIISASLSTLAIAIFVGLTPASVCADEACNCEYSGTYSHGACINAACPGEQVQQCKNGNWTGCQENCQTLEACTGG